MEFENKIGNELKAEEEKKRKRELILIVVILSLVGLLTYVESRVVDFGSAFPISNTILMFILINVNLLLLLLLFFLVFRNLLKLYYDRKRKIAGAKLRTRLVIAFITLTLLPSIVLFFFSINFISKSIAFWFNIPIELVLENSFKSGQEFYNYIEKENAYVLDKIIKECKERPGADEDLRKDGTIAVFISKMLEEYGLDALEVYDASENRFAVTKGIMTQNIQIDSIPARALLKNSEKFDIWSIREEIGKYEIVRTTGAVYGKNDKKQLSGYIAVSTRLPIALSRSLSQVNQGMEEYRRTILLKEPAENIYYLIMTIVALLVVFCAIWFAFYLAKTITTPIMELAEGTKRVAEGDFNFQIEPVSDDEIGGLVDSFNRMTREIGLAREQLSLSSRMLHQQNAEIEERRRYMEIVLKNVSAGVISIDPVGFVATVNTSAERMLGIASSEILRREYRILFPDNPEFEEKINQAIKSPAKGVEFQMNVMVGGTPRIFIAHCSALADESGNHLGIVTVLDDITELEKAQRMAAWREVAKRIAHEVKNPLTPLSLSAQRLRRKYPEMLNESVFDECTRTIITHVDLIRNLVNEFSTYARFPAAVLRPCILSDIITDTVALYHQNYSNINFILEISEGIPAINLDQQQIKQALINLFENAISAMNGTGTIYIIHSYDPVTRTARLDIEDTGPGIPDSEKTRVFEPYYSTKRRGTGLGLTIVNSIVSDHKGVIRAQTGFHNGARFIMEFPV
ncbi:sensor histidine kinase [Desulforegula conservatrix]|uniref:sensor histidine kinase n=1 Tax=Desulforegula conservatrix TaxID=153026 RepID=UPI00040B3449|nr:ATP-binding protein [Desulforegula conservatrix]